VRSTARRRRLDGASVAPLFLRTDDGEGRARVSWRISLVASVDPSSPTRVVFASNVLKTRWIFQRRSPTVGASLWLGTDADCRKPG
jgi:hypothetical protein